MIVKYFGAATVVSKSFCYFNSGNSDGVRERPESLALRPICRECIILMILNVGLLGGTMGPVYFRHTLYRLFIWDWGKLCWGNLNQMI